MKKSKDKTLAKQYEESKLRIEDCNLPPLRMSVQEVHDAISMLEHQMQLVPAYHDAIMLECMKCVLLQFELTDRYLAPEGETQAFTAIGDYTEKLVKLITERQKDD